MISVLHSIRGSKLGAAAVGLTVGLAALLAGTAADSAATPEVPVAAGVIFVIAVSNAPGQGTSAPATANVAQGDYELVVTLNAVEQDAISETAHLDALDAAGVRRQASISRRVQRVDLASAPLQILGFRSTDAPLFAGSTSLGPSRAVVDALVRQGRSPYAFRNFADQPSASGTLVRAEPGRVMFPVLINGRRVELAAIRATGQMSAGGATRPLELIVLDDAQHPLSLRIAYGPRNGSFPFKPDFAREIVRIDYPTPPALDDALQRDCHVEIPGLYFDFDQATLKPQSRPALEDIAAALRKRPQQPVRIEGHSDNIGSARYNDELSSHRAAAVRTALVQEHRVSAALVTTAGFGARRPVESNDTLAGRARNRRVELVRDCATAAPK